MLPISAIAPIFAHLDAEAGGDDSETVEKALRNFAQRFPIRPTEKAGRGFLYDRAAVVALRLGYVAHQFGLTRLLLHPYVSFLNDAAAEAIARVEAGEDFAFHVVARPIGNDIWASWEEPAADQLDNEDWGAWDDAKLDPAAARVQRVRWLMRKNPAAIELGRFTQQAGLVAQILPYLRDIR